MNSKSDQLTQPDGLSNVQSLTSAQESATSSQTTNKFMPTYQEVKQYAWEMSNFSIVAFATSASIVAVQSPVKTMLVNLSKSGSFMPPYQGGVLGFMRALYAGTSASLSGSVVRTAYVTGAKNSKPIEEGLIREEKRANELSAVKMGYVLSMAFGDILVTQIPESLSQLRKVPGLLPTNFQWKNYHNASRLMFGGFTPRYCSGIVNFASLCLLEEEFVKMMPTHNKQAAHFYAGALSGMTAAFFSYPFTSFKDYLAVRATVTDGLLYNASAFTALKDLTYSFMASPAGSAKSFGANAVKQLPLRMGLTGVIFSLVAGVGAVLGSEPLKAVVSDRFQPSSVSDNPQSFFSASKATGSVEENGKQNDNVDLFSPKAL